MDTAVVLRWRRATIFASGVAVVELLALVAVGVVILAPRVSRHVQERAVQTAAARPKPVAPVLPRVVAAVARLPRAETSVLVLNGNGRAGAATAGAARLTALGYVVGGVGDAPHMLPRTTIMYRPGYRGEGERLARDLHVRVVGPLDGMRPAQLLGAHLALILGDR
jgi:hypothetical protein